MGLIASLSGNKTKVQFFQKNDSGYVSVMQFDASISEKHSRESPATEFPVENGYSISDHIIIRPFALEITAMISDTPINSTNSLVTEAATTLTSSLVPPVGIVTASAGYALFNTMQNGGSSSNGQPSPSPSKIAYQQILNLQANATPVDVLTTLYRYPSMWIRSVSVPRDSQTGNCILVTISLVQLILVSPQSVNIAIFSNPGLASNLNNLGEQNPELASQLQAGRLGGLKLVGQ